MAAEIVPFPQARRRDFIVRHARQMAGLSAQAAENWLSSQLRIQVQAMSRKGIVPAVVERERRALENAIRAQLWHLVLLPEKPGGAA